jgi:NAD(P)-dependent dehydrogenase (short-subunit alcohol dehydrogenase family)
MSSDPIIFPSPTKITHNEPYAAIDPSQPHLSAAGKTILITGGGRGIGLSIAKSFAKAGADVVGITGRTLKTLESSKAEIETQFPNTRVVIATSNISDPISTEESFEKVAKGSNGIDVLVHNAAYFPYGELFKDLKGDKLKDWWKGYETNVLGSVVQYCAFLKYMSAKNPKLIAVSTGGILPPSLTSTILSN